MRNYSRVFLDSEAINAFYRTVLWCLLNVPLWLAASFSLALILNQGIRARGFFRTLILPAQYRPGSRSGLGMASAAGPQQWRGQCHH